MRDPPTIPRVPSKDADPQTVSAGGKSCGWPGLCLFLLLHLLTAALPHHWALCSPVGPGSFASVILQGDFWLAGTGPRGRGLALGASEPPGEVGGGRIKEETRKLLPSGVASPRPEGELGFALFLHSWSNRAG